MEKHQFPLKQSPTQTIATSVLISVFVSHCLFFLYFNVKHVACSGQILARMGQKFKEIHLITVVCTQRHHWG